MWLRIRKFVFRTCMEELLRERPSHWIIFPLRSEVDSISYEVGWDRRGLCGVKRRSFGKWFGHPRRRAVVRMKMLWWWVGGENHFPVVGLRRGDGGRRGEGWWWGELWRGRGREKEEWSFEKPFLFERGVFKVFQWRGEREKEREAFERE